MNELKISLIQSELFWESPEKNLEQFDHLCDAIPDPVDIILLPEMFTTGFSVNPGLCVESANDPGIKFLEIKAKEKACSIIGSLMVRNGNRCYNRLICMDEHGRVVQYDKRHLFRLSDESKVFSPGKEKVIFRYRGWNILPLVCYDLRFPVWSKNRIIDNDYEYDLLLYVANWPESRATAWKSLLVARAIENQAYVAGVNRFGKDGFGTNHAGDSMIIDPKGGVIAAANYAAPAICSAVLSLEELKSFRTSFPLGPDWDRFTIND